MLNEKVFIMNYNENIKKLIEDALNSVDDISKAEVKPYLLTRINAKMAKVSESAWDKAGRFIAKPAIAFTSLCIILLVNATVFFVSTKSPKYLVTEQFAQQTLTDEFSYTATTIYDFDNTKP